MADNTIDWGQGANTNSISWGSGASNNTNGWGVIHEMSYGHPETDLVGDGVVPPVNPFDNASVVFSLRDIFGTNNAVVRVRRDSDNTEQDFTASELTDGTLLAFVGGGNGFVSTWYDQKNSNNAIQTTSTLQPIIVSLGVILTDGGNPTINFTDSTRKLAFNQVITGTSPRSMFFVNKPNTANNVAGENCLISLNDTVGNQEVHIEYAESRTI